MSGSVNFRLDDKIFFVYDQEKVQDEHDDLSDGIVYFFPSSLDITSQCALCGQLVGMFLFFTHMAGSPPIIFKLTRRKFAIKQLGRLLLVLGDVCQKPDAILQRQLERLCQFCIFYRGSISELCDIASGAPACVREEMHAMWQQCLAFVWCGGDDVAATFQSVPSLDLPRSASSLMRKASDILQTCRRYPFVLGGCVLFKNRVVCTQLSCEITSRLLSITLQHTRLPCQRVPTDYDMPSNTHLFAVHLTADEHAMLRPACVQRDRSGDDDDTPSSVSPLSRATQTASLRADETHPVEGRTGSRTSKHEGEDEDEVSEVVDGEAMSAEDADFHSLSEALSETSVDGRAADGKVLSETSIDGRAAVEETFSETSVDGRAAVEETLSETSVDGRAAVEETLSETSVDGRAADEETFSETSVDGRAAVEEALSETSVDGRAAVEETLSETSVDSRAAVEETLSETSVDDRAANDSGLILESLSQQPETRDTSTYSLAPCTSDLDVSDVSGSETSEVKDVSFAGVGSDREVAVGRGYSMAKGRDRSGVDSRYRGIAEGKDFSIRHDRGCGITEDWNRGVARDTDCGRTDVTDCGVAQDTDCGRTDVTDCGVAQDTDCGRTDVADCGTTGDGGCGRTEVKTTGNRCSKQSTDAPACVTTAGDVETDDWCLTSGGRSADEDVDVESADEPLGAGTLDIACHEDGGGICSSCGKRTGNGDRNTSTAADCVCSERADRRDDVGGTGARCTCDVIGGCECRLPDESGGGAEGGVSPPDGTAPRHDLVKVNLYVHGHSDLTLMLLLREAQPCQHLVRHLWSSVCATLTDLCSKIQLSLQQTAATEANSPSFNYDFLNYDSYSNHLMGKITQPSKQLWENDIYRTAMFMHDEFNQTEQLKETTLKTKTSCVYSHRSDGQQTFYQQKQTAPSLEAPTEKDSAMCLDRTAGQQLLQDHHIHLD